MKRLLQKGAMTALLIAPLTLWAQNDLSGSASVKKIASYSEPAISPDGKEIAFVSGGDIWTVPSSGGEARLLISHPDYDSRPLYSPDGKYLAFNSTRTGNGDIYVLNIATNELKRVTFDDANDELSAWSADGQYLYFSSLAYDISAMRDIYRVKRSGGTPMAVSATRYMNEFFGAPSPDGKALAFTARGVASHQWWRNGHSHLDESELWLLHDGKEPRYEQLTEGGARNLWPMWSSDGTTVYYISDQSGAQNIWMRSLNGKSSQITDFKKGRVLWPTISANANSIVFERDFKIWKYDIATKQAAAVSIALRGAPASTGTEHVRLTNGFRELALSPDSKKVAFIAHGEVFVASAKDGGDALRITNSAAPETGVIWAPNSNSLIYVSTRDKAAHLYQYNFITGKETRLTNDDNDDATPVFSSNGKQVAFVRNGQELRVLDMTTNKETMLTKGYFGRPPFVGSGTIVWSPDNKWIAYAALGAKSFRNIYVVPAAGGEARQVSFLANSFGGNLSWSTDGTYLLFTTTQRTEDTKVARIDLVPQRPRFREDQFQQMFVEQTTSPAAPVNPTAPKISTDKVTKPDSAIAGIKTVKSNDAKIVWEGIRQRLNLLPLDVDVASQSISKDGKTLLLTAAAGGQLNIYTYSLDELSQQPAVLKQITSTASGKSNVQLSFDGREIYYLEQGRIQAISVDTKQPRPVSVTAEMDVDFNNEKLALFQQAWDLQNKSFYDPAFHGTNWNAVHETYEPLVAGSSTPDELRRILNLMVGELNASHSGVSAPPGGPGFTVGKLGLLFDRKEYEDKGKFKITEVIALDAADLAGSIKEGDYLAAIDDVPLTASTNLQELLQNKVDRKLMLTIATANGGTNRVSIRPVNTATEKGLLYKQWVQQQRDYVAKKSNGRLGYVHIFDMSPQSLDQLFLDLDAENHSREGVVVDVRNNNGGFVNAYALDVLSRKGYLTMQIRGMPAAPARTQLGQRALDAPTILVTNQHSLSDAEDFTEGYRALGLGKVVGEPTGGWIIFTSNIPIMDGSVVRLPFERITDHEGKDMELHPRPVDILVSRSFNEGNEKDSQLDAAVKELLEQIGKKTSQR